MTSTDSAAMTSPLNMFISYSHKDEDLREELDVHLANLKRQGQIRAWHDRAIEAGAEWEKEIKQQLESASIILLLISPRFMASEYCYDLEMERAMQRHDEGTARVIPIILKPVDWTGTPFRKLQALPTDAKPITSWIDRDEAFLNVVQGIRRAVKSLKKQVNNDESTPTVPNIESVSMNQESERLNNDVRSGGNYFQGKEIHIYGGVVGRDQNK